MLEWYTSTLEVRMPQGVRVRVSSWVQKQSENDSESEHSSSVFSSFSFCFSLNSRMFEFQNLEVYKKAKVFHLECKSLIFKNKLDNFVKDQVAGLHLSSF